MYMKAIELHHLTKSYGKHRGIIDVNLEVEKGDFFGFIGPNGAGKSTTIRTLLGLIEKTSGSASLLGTEIGLHNTEVLSDIGYLPSEVQFYPGMKVKDVIQFSASLHKKDCTQEAKRLCEVLDLDWNRKVDELSLGNRKKVGIVCAMQHKPSLYILDEPTSGLDPLMQRAFYTLLQERNKEGATIFLSSHILSEIQKYCHHAAVIREGKILVCDTVDAIGSSDLKKVKIQGQITLPNIEGMSNIKQEEEKQTFFYKGPIQTLIQALSSLEIEDLTITEPDLEDVFLQYYETEESR